MASIREVTGCATAHIFSTFTMSAPSKSNTPTATNTTWSKDWVKAATPELNPGMDDEDEVVIVKQGEHKWHKQVRLVEQEK